MFYNPAMEWWMWLVGGMFLMVLELVTSGFFIIFFGLGAITVGLIANFAPAQAGGSSGSSSPFSLSCTWRSSENGCNRGSRIRRRRQVDSLVGGLAIAQEPLAPGVVGRVEVRGSAWSARNTSGVGLQAGQRCRVVSVDGLTLAVVPE